MKIFSKIINNISGNLNNDKTARYLTKMPNDSVTISSKKVKTPTFKEMIYKLHGGLSKPVVKELDKIDSPVDFMVASLDHIMKSIGFSERIRPACYLIDLDKSIAAMYKLNDNGIYINNTQLNNKSKSSLFNFIRHEIKHVEQIYNGLRVEKFTEESLDLITGVTNKSNIENLKVLALSNKKEDILKLLESGVLRKEQYDVLIRIKELNEISPEKLDGYLEELYDADYPIIRKGWEDIQKMVIEDLGMIKDGTYEAKDAKQIFRSSLNPKNVNSIGYITSPHEIDAYGAGSVAFWKYLFSRLF